METQPQATGGGSSTPDGFFAVAGCETPTDAWKPQAVWTFHRETSNVNASPKPKKSQKAEKWYGAPINGRQIWFH